MPDEPAPEHEAPKPEARSGADATVRKKFFKQEPSIIGQWFRRGLGLRANSSATSKASHWPLARTAKWVGAFVLLFALISVLLAYLLVGWPFGGPSAKNPSLNDFTDVLKLLFALIAVGGAAIGLVVT